jgi:hypothetical protein
MLRGWQGAEARMSICYSAGADDWAFSPKGFFYTIHASARSQIGHSWVRASTDVYNAAELLDAVEKILIKIEGDKMHPPMSIELLKKTLGVVE